MKLSIKVRIRRFIKSCLALVMNVTGCFKRAEKALNQKYDNNYIRIVNYHNYSDKACKLEKQFQFYNKHYQNIDKQTFTDFLDGSKKLEGKPGIMVTFDDGLIGNYKYSVDLLDKYNLTGYFFLSPGLIGNEGYMTKENIKDIINRGHQIGCHTYTHKRIYGDETEDVLNYEIVESKTKLEEMFDVDIDMFCWCGGERGRYSNDAYKHIVKADYKYAFTTNARPIVKDTNKHNLTRSNVEENFDMSTAKFQVSSYNDKYYNKKYEEELQFFVTEETK